MNGVQLHHGETIFSTPFLRRLQIPTGKPLDRCCQALIRLFVDRYGDKIGEIIKLDQKKLLPSELESFFTVHVKAAEVGVNTERNPSRALTTFKTRLDTLYSHPYIIYDTTNKNGKRKYCTLPLLIYNDVDPDGNCTFIFNPLLRYHVSSSYTMEDNYSPCSIDLLSEIKEINIYAGILYEEACSWVNYYNRGNDPFFNWSVTELRQKFSFDLMTDISKDGTEYIIVPVRNMRINNLIKNVLNPAIDDLKKLYSQGKTAFWLDMKTYFTGTKRVGRPPKDSFQFFIRKSPINDVQNGFQEAVQLDMFDSYEEINNYTELSKELGIVLDSKKYIADIIKQIQDREPDGQNLSEAVLTKVRDHRTRYKDKSKKARRNILLTALWCDFGIGKEPSKKSINQKVKSKVWPENADWPDNIDGKIEAMKKCYEIFDKAARDFSLAQDDVLRRLDVHFRAFCKKTNKPLRNWEDATNLFYSVIDKKWLLGYSDYGNKQRTTCNVSGTAASKFFNEPAEELDR